MSAPFRSKPQKPSRHGVGDGGAHNIPPTGGSSLRDLDDYEQPVFVPQSRHV
jgi:hypothetical protein